MKVRVAKSAGFCFGVKRAVQMVYDEAEKNPGKVYTMGPIIHNEQVVGDLSRKGVRMIGDDLVCTETGQMPPEGSVIIVRSHGISRQMTEKLQKSGYRIVTATCPFVQKIHDIVAQKSREGYGIIIVGNPGHPEVIGIRGWAEGPCAVVESAEDARRLAGQSACTELADESEKSTSGGAAFAGNGLCKEKKESEKGNSARCRADFDCGARRGVLCMEEDAPQRKRRGGAAYGDGLARFYHQRGERQRRGGGEEQRQHYPAL